MTIKNKPHPITILMAEDDPDDRLLVKEAFQESRVANSICFVEDGVELLNYLRRQGKFKSSGHFPAPDLILLDLNMPCKDGREALEEIKADPHLRHIPVVVLTTSKTEEDILRSYDIGAAGFITKPVTFEALVKVVQGLQEYWVQIVLLPPSQSEKTKK
jgi:two-component system response regulator